MNIGNPAVAALLTGLLLATPDASTTEPQQQILTPVADISVDAGWSLYSDNATFAEALADVRADMSVHDGLASAVRSLGSGFGHAFEVRLKSGAPPAGDRVGDHVLHVWARQAQAEAAYRVALVQGATTIWISPITPAGASFEEQRFVVPQMAALTITDYFDLRLRVYKANRRNVFLSKLYLEFGEDQAPRLRLSDRPHTEPASFEMGQFEVGPLGRTATITELLGNEPFEGYCALIDQSTGLMTPPDGRGISMGRLAKDAPPQIGRRTAGGFAVALDLNGYIVTCDIDEADVAASVVTVWAGPDLDPEDADPDQRARRASIFATRDFTQPDRIVVYQYRNPATDVWELRLVNLDADPLTHHLIWTFPPPPPGRVHALILSTQRTLDGTPYWFWGGYPSQAPGTLLQVYRLQLSDPAEPVVERVTDEPDDVLYGWAFVGNDGRQRWAAGFNPGGGPGSPGMRVYVEAKPYWQLEDEYPIDSALWTPTFVRPGRGQSPEVVGPDAAGDYYLVWSTHDYQDAVGPVAMGAYGKIALAVIGRPDSVVIASRKQNHQTQVEPEPYIANGRFFLSYTETRTGLAPHFGVASQQQRVVTLIPLLVQ